MTLDTGRIGALLERWEQLRKQGRPISPEELCAGRPELVEELRRRIRALESMDQRSRFTATLPTQPMPPDTVPDDAPNAGERSDPVEAMSISRFHDIEFFDSGGLGEIFLARDEDLGRTVVLKFIKPRLAADLETRSRFQLEAEITAQLDHPGVAPVYGMGSIDNRPFYAMRFIRGGTLLKAIEEFHSRADWTIDDLKELVRSFIVACETIAYAHNRGVVHCDLKPHNIMLGRYGETLVVDWGLALPVERDARARSSGEQTLRPSSGDSETSSGSRVGTPAYMSPEQTPDSLEPIGPATDIYSLGATLYHLLTGIPPFRGQFLLEVIDRIRRGEYAPVTKIQTRVPAPLESICAKAMSLDPKDRYATALEMARDLENWRVDAPVSAYKEPMSETLLRWARQHQRSTLSAASGVLLAIVVAVFSTFWMARSAHRERAARVAAEVAREARLRSNAELAAEMLANQIDLRWRILETEALDPLIRRNLADAMGGSPGDESWERLQAWLNDRFIEHAGMNATSWIICDAKGVLVARSPRTSLASKSIGRSFRFRDYFHGLGHDLVPGEAEKVEPIRDVTLSSVFRSTSTGNLMISFTAPIWSDAESAPARDVVGVLGMTIEIARFASLERGIDNSQTCVLVDTRMNQLGDREYEGLFLHHPRLVALRVDSEASNDLLFELDDDHLRRLDRLRRSRLERLRNYENLTLAQRMRVQQTEPPESLDASYHDPVAVDPADRWLAAFEPILIQGRPEPARDTGLAIIVQERHE